MLLTAWTIIKFAAFTGFILSALFFLFTFFHPLKFNARLRSSIKGQRGELWFVYLFNSFKIGVIATPHTQDVVVKFLFWKYVIKRNQRLKKNAKRTEEDVKSPTSGSGIADDLTPIQPEVTSEGLEAATVDGKQEVGALEEEAKEDIADIPEKCEEIKSDKTPIDTLSDEKAKVDLESLEAEDILPIETKVPDETLVADVDKEKLSGVTEPDISKIDPTPIKLPSEEEVFETKNNDEKVDKVEEKPLPLKDKLRNLKKLASQKYKEFKHWFSFAMKKWAIIKPILFRFWARLKQGFKLDSPELKMHYALHEHHLTGMAQGSLSVLSGMLQSLGVTFTPIPEFSSPMIYVRGNMTAIVKPWRLLLASVGLLFELRLWKELWALGKWYWNKRKSKA